MGPKPKDKGKLRMKTTKKQKRKKTSISDTCDDGKANVKNQTLLKTLGDDKASREKNGQIEIKEEGKRRVKNEKSVATDKLKEKSVRVKAERNTSLQKAASTDEKEPFRRPSIAVEQDSEQITLNENNESGNQDTLRSYEDQSPKTHRKNSAKNGGQRKRKIRSKSKSPSRDANPPDRKEDITLHREAGNINFPESERNNSPKQREQRNNRNESPGRHLHDGIERSRSPILSDSRENDSHPKSKKVKRSPGSITINKHRSSSVPRNVTSPNNDNQQRYSEDKGSSTATRGRSPKPRHDKDAEQESTENKPSAETSVKPDRNPPHSHKEINESQKDSFQRRVECKEVRGKSPKIRLKTSNLRKDSRQTIKKSKMDGGPKSLPGFRSSGMKVLSGKKTKNVTEAEAKSKEKKGKRSKKIRKKLLKSSARKKVVNR